MNPTPPPARPTPARLAEIPHTPAAHMRLALFAVVAHLIERWHAGDQRPDFLSEYQQEIAALLEGEPSAADFRAAMRSWEAAAPPETCLPLNALARAGIGPVERELLLCAGLVEEDPRFGDLFEQATGRERRPTIGLLLGIWHGAPGPGHDAAELRAALRHLAQTGLLQAGGQSMPQSERPVAVPAPVWAVLQGEPPELAGIRHIGRAALTPLADYVAPEAACRLYHELPRLLEREPDRLLVVRGPAGNGRRTLLGAIAHALGRGLLLADAALATDPGRWRCFGAIAALIDALPAIDLPLAPGQTQVLPALPFPDLPLGVVTGGRGGVASEDDRPVLAVERPLPDAAARRELWHRAAPDQPAAALDRLARGMRLGSGTIARCARTALIRAALAGRQAIAPEDAREAARALGAPLLETVAARLETRGSLDDLALDETTRDELALLAAQCRHREAIAAGPFDPETAGGVRALLAGPTGTGKTLAARLLAAALGKDLYRIDLAATVSKYIGETEKNLDAAFTAAEALDIVLLLDEGDALMTARTDVGSSNDRYANLETNFLLQRMEQFGGILLVTTNAADRIDHAFARRMDVVIHFRPPDEQRRYEILRLHLGDEAGADAIGEGLLYEIAWRCTLTGGQLRNLVRHARLLALDAERKLSDDDLRAAVRREYRKIGAPCPLRVR